MVHNPRRFAPTIALILLTLATGSASAQEAPESPEVGVCLPGAGYSSGCDVDQDGDIDIFDIQLTAGLWSTSGVYTSGHTHWGETWTGAVGAAGLRLEHTAASGFTYGVYGQSASSDGIGVFGRTTATSGGTIGVYGRSDSIVGSGVYGAASAASGATNGVYGYSASSAGHAGHFEGSGADALYVQNWSNGRAIQAYAPNDSGVWGKTDSGLAGVDGWNASTSGRGVSGWASASNGYTYGVYGESASTNGRGVYGLATATSGSAIGVYGVTGSDSGYAGYFVGRVHVLGTLSKSAGSFKIDHPLDPANQYLSHSFVESPDMMNVYNGNVMLDEKGEAWVELPEWFEALNRDFRYQLTPIGGPGPDLYIAQEVQNNRFHIAGGSAGLRVSWQVTGIRQDAYANAHRIPVEEQKPADERGLYLHPTELGEPAELGLDYQRNAMRTEQFDSP